MSHYSTRGRESYRVPLDDNILVNGRGLGSFLDFLLSVAPSVPASFYKMADIVSVKYMHIYPHSIEEHCIALYDVDKGVSVLYAPDKKTIAQHPAIATQGLYTIREWIWRTYNILI